MGKGPEEIFFQRKHTSGQQVHEKVLNITNHQGNENQNHNEVSLTAVRMATVKKEKREQMVARM